MIIFADLLNFDFDMKFTGKLNYFTNVGGGGFYEVFQKNLG